MTRFVPVAMVLALAAAACSNTSSSSSSNATTTAPTPTATVETFSGTVAVNGSDAHNFSVGQLGAVSVTLTAAGPPSDISMGLGIGLASGGACSILPGASTTAQAGSSAQLSGTVSSGTFCVQVSDIGHQTGPINYTVTVSHL